MPIMTTRLFIMYVFFSHLSLITPKTSDDRNPKMERLSAVMSEYYDLKAGKQLPKKTGM